jgi:arabinose-5-phosphate isomerase
MECRLDHAPSLQTPFEQLHAARTLLQTYAAALSDLAARLPASFTDAVRLVFECSGSVIVTGMGKAGLIGQKVAATFASTGTPSHFLHPAEAVHGDLGRVRPGDVVLVFSSSGETAEIVRLLPALAGLETQLVAITCRKLSTLARAAAVVIDLGRVEEACPLGLAPSTSTALMLSVGDALALVVSQMRGFGAADFARFHPGGSLGLKLSRVEDQMRPLETCRVAHQGQSVREVFMQGRRPGRRTGAVMLVDDSGRLTGLFTDSDLARLFEQRRDSLFDGPVRDVMTVSPTSITIGSKLTDALALLAARKFSELPVVDAAGRPRGLIDITDVIGLLPEPAAPAQVSPRAKTA